MPSNWPVPGKVTEIMKKYGRLVYEQNFTMPNGKVEPFFLFASSNKPAIVLPITVEGNVIAIRQFRYAACEVMTEVPGGNPKPEQSSEDCIKAELLEETGCEATELVKLGEGIWFDPASWKTHFVAYLALGCKPVAEPKLDPTEFMEWLNIPIREWLCMAMRGEIKDSKTLAVTLMALPYLGFEF